MLPSFLETERTKLDATLVEHAREVDHRLVPELIRWLRTGDYDSKLVFKVLWRFNKVARAYQSKKAGWSSARCKQLWERMQSVFCGDDPAGLLSGVLLQQLLK